MSHGVWSISLTFLGVAWSIAGCACHHDGQSAREAAQPTADPITTSQPVADASGPRAVDFQPGIRIDFRVPQVEIEGEVILRKGPIELFAYSKAPVPKEHESIIRLEASPERIYQALGLVGLQPGTPPRFFPETGVSRSASGDAVDVLVRYQAEDRTVEVSACAWMRDLEKDQVMQSTHWLFTGSERWENGTFAANNEGTVVTVVDFPSSLLALPTSHTDSDEALWLGANTEAIPRIGTPVVLVLRPVQ